MAEILVIFMSLMTAASAAVLTRVFMSSRRTVQPAKAVESSTQLSSATDGQLQKMVELARTDDWTQMTDWMFEHGPVLRYPETYDAKLLVEMIRGKELGAKALGLPSFSSPFREVVGERPLELVLRDIRKHWETAPLALTPEIAELLAWLQDFLDNPRPVSQPTPVEKQVA